MNQIFSAPRFGAYFKKSFFEQIRNTLLQFVIMTGVLAFVIALNDNRLMFFSNTLIFFIFSVAIASRFSDNFKTRPRKIEFLLTPASQFEKFLSFMIQAFIIVPILYTIAIFFAQYIAILLVAIFRLSAPVWTVPFSVVEIDTDFLAAFSISYFGSVAYYILGSTIWPRNSFLKTTAVTFAIGLVYTLLITISITSIAIQKLFIMNARELSLLHNIGSIAWTVTCIASILLTIIYLVIAYVRVTEFEVNETKH